MWRWSPISACQLGWHRSAWDHSDQGCWCCHSYSLSEDINQDFNPCGQERSPNALHLGSNISSVPWLSSTLLSENWPLTSHTAQRAPATQKTACFERQSLCTKHKNYQTRRRGGCCMVISSTSCRRLRAELWETPACVTSSVSKWHPCPRERQTSQCVRWTCEAKTWFFLVWCIALPSLQRWLDCDHF